MQCVKAAVKLRRQAQGHKVHHFSAEEITLRAEEYFDNHTMEPITKATEHINTSPYFERWRLPDCANLKGSVSASSSGRSLG
jgi:hypothetical protein